MKHQYNKAQLNAISRYYTEKRLAEFERKAQEYGILNDFEKQKQYKTLRGFVLAYERRRNDEQSQI